VFSGADMQMVDKSGRVLVKPDLRKFADLNASTEIAVIGVFDHVELWNMERYLADRAAGDESYLEEGE
jgi:DNA-binding transcriptional regulator/RsmH inhibitor MraZ